MRIAQVFVDYGAIEHTLGLPEGVHIIAVVPQRAEDIAWLVQGFVIEGNELPDITDGSVLPIIKDFGDYHE